MRLQLEQLVAGKKASITDNDANTLLLWSQARKHGSNVLPKR